VREPFEIELRVRYEDADPMGVLHHAKYFTYFEIGRTEMLRAAGGNHRSLEEDGVFFVVVKANCRYHRPAYYDDLLTIRTTIGQSLAQRSNTTIVRCVKVSPWLRDR